MSASWLADRLRDVPASLRSRIEQALAAEPAEQPTPAARFRRAAERLLEESKAGATRDSAMSLLAADALITLACEWTAEHAPERLAGMTC